MEQEQTAQGPKVPWDRLMKDLGRMPEWKKTEVIYQGKKYDAVIINGKTYVELKRI